MDDWSSYILFLLSPEHLPQYIFLSAFVIKSFWVNFDIHSIFAIDQKQLEFSTDLFELKTKKWAWQEKK